MFVLPPLECVVDTEYYDERSKLINGTTSYVVPADLSRQLRAAMHDAALGVYQHLGCSGTTRVDFVVSSDREEAVALEINTIPGVQPGSNLVLATAQSGISYGDLILSLLFAGLRDLRTAPWQVSTEGPRGGGSDALRAGPVSVTV